MMLRPGQIFMMARRMPAKALAAYVAAMKAAGIEIEEVIAGPDGGLRVKFKGDGEIVPRVDEWRKELKQWHG